MKNKHINKHRLEEISSERFFNELKLLPFEIGVFDRIKEYEPSCPKFPPSLRERHYTDSVGKHISMLRGFKGRYSNWKKDHFPYLNEHKQKLISSLEHSLVNKI